MSSYQTQTIPFTPGITNQGIDNFEFPYDMLTADGFLVSRVQLANEGQYEEPLWGYVKRHLEKELLDDFASSFGEQTIVLDIQVGRGKTTACYDLIDQYCKDDKVTVIMVSPFRKLVDKDYNEIKAKRLSAFHYGQLEREQDTGGIPILEYALMQQVHVMTVNCLLQNPGEDAFDTSDVKKEYLRQLLEYCRTDKRRVIMFFDEIHEAIYNFLPQFIPNLYRWREVVSLCFVASATFNAASYPVTKYISLLTGRTITIISVDRAKWHRSTMSNLHVHIITDVYSSSNLHPLVHLKSILRHCTGKQVNILTGTKSLTEALMSKTGEKGKENSFYEFLEPFNFNIVTPDYENAFVSDGNNIGTTFKTGVNIKCDGKESVLIIILPVVTQNSNENIFSDGIPSIVQAIGRLRQSGNIHVFMYRPTHLLEPDTHSVWQILIDGDKDFDNNSDKRIPYRFLKQFLSASERLSFSELTNNTKQVPFIEQRKSVEKLKERYDALKDDTHAEVELLETQEKGIGYRYPSFEEYLIEEGHKLVRNYPQFGSDLSSYVFWAALNDQFCNASLQEITYTSRPRRDVELDETNIKAGLLSVLTERIVTQACLSSRLRDAIEYMLIALGRDSDGTELHYKYKNGTYKVTKLKTVPAVMQTVVDICVEKYSAGRITTLSKEDYILACCLKAGRLTPEERDTDLKNAYHSLNIARQQFIGWLNEKTIPNDTGALLVHKDIYRDMPETRVLHAKILIGRLNTLDTLVSAKAYPFLPTISKLTSQRVIADKVYKEFEKCFTTIGGRPKSYRGEEVYYAAQGQIERSLPEAILSLPLM